MSPRLETPTMLHWRAVLAALALAAAAVVPLAARAQNAIQSITSSQQAGTEVVRMSGSGATCFALFDSEAGRDAAALAVPETWWHLATVLR